MDSPEAAHPISFDLPANGLRFRVLSWPGDRGRLPFLLLHGLASNARIWEPVGARLSAAGHRVLAPDLRGHGLSDAPDDGYDFDTVTRDVAGLVAALDVDGVAVAGHSWGGMVALNYAAQHGPAALAMIDGGFTQLSDSPGATWEKVEHALAPPRLAGTPLPELLDRLESLHPDWPVDLPWREIVLANFEVRPDGTIAPHLSYENHMKVVRAMWEFPTYDRFDRVRCPALMVAARRGDPHTRSEDAFLQAKRRGEQQARARLARGRFVWLEDADHDIPLHRPFELSELMLDLARLGRRE